MWIGKYKKETEKWYQLKQSTIDSFSIISEYGNYEQCLKHNKNSFSKLGIDATKKEYSYLLNLFDKAISQTGEIISCSQISFTQTLLDSGIGKEKVISYLVQIFLKSNKSSFKFLFGTSYVYKEFITIIPDYTLDYIDGQIVVYINALHFYYNHLKCGKFEKYSLKGKFLTTITSTLNISLKDMEIRRDGTCFLIDSTPGKEKSFILDLRSDKIINLNGNYIHIGSSYPAMKIVFLPNVTQEIKQKAPLFFRELIIALNFSSTNRSLLLLYNQDTEETIFFDTQYHQCISLNKVEKVIRKYFATYQISSVANIKVFKNNLSLDILTEDKRIICWYNLEQNKIIDCGEQESSKEQVIFLKYSTKNNDIFLKLEDDCYVLKAEKEPNRILKSTIKFLEFEKLEQRILGYDFHNGLSEIQKNSPYPFLLKCIKQNCQAKDFLALATMDDYGNVLDFFEIRKVIPSGYQDIDDSVDKKYFDFNFYREKNFLVLQFLEGLLFINSQNGKISYFSVEEIMGTQFAKILNYQTLEGTEYGVCQISSEGKLYISYINIKATIVSGTIVSKQIKQFDGKTDNMVFDRLSLLVDDIYNQYTLPVSPEYSKKFNKSEHSDDVNISESLPTSLSIYEHNYDFLKREINFFKGKTKKLGKMNIEHFKKWILGTSHISSANYVQEYFANNKTILENFYTHHSNFPYTTYYFNIPHLFKRPLNITNYSHLSEDNLTNKEEKKHLNTAFKFALPLFEVDKTLHLFNLAGNMVFGRKIN